MTAKKLGSYIFKCFTFHYSVRNFDVFSHQRCKFTLFWYLLFLFLKTFFSFTYLSTFLQLTKTQVTASLNSKNVSRDLFKFWFNFFIFNHYGSWFQKKSQKKLEKIAVIKIYHGELFQLPNILLKRLSITDSWKI